MTFQAIFSSVLPDYLRDLETLVNQDCGTQYKPGVDTVARVVRERMSAFGLEVIEFPQEQYGNMLYGCIKGRGLTRILMLGHLDTVFPEGTVRQYPFHKKEGRFKGPGISDMKAGLLAGLYAVRALVRSGFDNFEEIGLFCNSEEEIGSPVSRNLYEPFVRRADAVLVLEAARENGAIVSARKGGGRLAIKVCGKAAHAGVAPEAGANAVLALAHHIIAFQSLNGFRPGLTVNVGTIRGGTQPNVVADAAEAQVDVRIQCAADTAPLEQAMREILARQVVTGTGAQLYGSANNPPMEKTVASAHLVALAKQAAQRLGLEIQDVATGGSSDGNFTSALGVPTLDGLGPIGGKGHNAQEEFMDADSLVSRLTLLAEILVAIANDKSKAAPDNPDSVIRRNS